MNPQQPLLADGDRTRLVQRFGTMAEAWCDGLPSMVAAIASEWRLSVEWPLPAGANSIVLPCASEHGEDLVLKLTPDITIAAHEAVALTAWESSSHVVALVDHDPARGALLLVRVRPGVQLSQDPQGWSLEDVAPMLAELWRPSPTETDSSLPLLRDRVDLVFDLARRRLRRAPAVDARISLDLVQRSQDRCHALAMDGPVGMVHGDLHPGNVLRGTGGVVAIDPRPCRGDRAVDAVDWVLSEVVDSRGLEGRIDWLTRAVEGVEAERVWAWCQAMAVIVAASMLTRRADDPVGEFLLRLSQSLSS